MWIFCHMSLVSKFYGLWLTIRDVSSSKPQEKDSFWRNCLVIHNGSRHLNILSENLSQFPMWKKWSLLHKFVFYNKEGPFLRQTLHFQNVRAKLWGKAWLFFHNFTYYIHSEDLIRAIYNIKELRVKLQQQCSIRKC